MASTLLTLFHDAAFARPTYARKKDLLRLLVRQLMGALIGAGQSGVTAFAVQPNGASPVHASATVLFSGATGTVGAVVNGITLTFTHGASDAADAVTLAANINASADALVQHLVRATEYRAVLNLASVVAGTTVEVFGVRFTATAAATGKVGDFNIGGSDAQDATALAAAINAHPALAPFVVARGDSAAVTIAPVTATLAAHLPSRILASAATITVTALAATTTVTVVSAMPTILGNQTTLAASGIGVTASGARLTGGAGGSMAPIVDRILGGGPS